MADLVTDYAKTTTEVGAAVLSVSATVVDSGIWLRERVGSAELSDGTKVEVAMNLAGNVLVTIYPPQSGAGWRTYVLDPAELCAAVLLAEGRGPATPPSVL